MVNKDNEIVIREETIPVVRQEFIDEIQNLHNEIQGHIKMTVEKAVRLGELLTAVKEMLPFGEFGKWIESNCGFSVRTSQRYIKVFEKRQEHKYDTVSHLSEIYNLITPPKETQSDDSDVVQIIEADESKELRELSEKYESLEANIKTMVKIVDDKDREIEKLKELIDKSESLESEPPEKLLAYKRIADEGGDPEADLKIFSKIDKVIKSSRKFFSNEALQLQAEYIPDIAKKDLKKEVVSLLKAVGVWTNAVASQFDVKQEDL